jgi:hypothetical protein
MQAMLEAQHRHREYSSERLGLGSRPIESSCSAPIALDGLGVESRKSKTSLEGNFVTLEPQPTNSVLPACSDTGTGTGTSSLACPEDTTDDGEFDYGSKYFKVSDWAHTNFYAQELFSCEGSKRTQKLSSKPLQKLKASVPPLDLSKCVLCFATPEVFAPRKKKTEEGDKPVS